MGLIDGHVKYQVIYKFTSSSSSSSSQLAFHVLGPVAYNGLLPAFERSSQRPLFFLLLTENLEWDSRAGHSKKIFLFYSFIIFYELHDWLRI
jgi:hypothetical protein